MCVLIKQEHFKQLNAAHTYMRTVHREITSSSSIKKSVNDNTVSSGASTSNER